MPEVPRQTTLPRKRPTKETQLNDLLRMNLFHDAWRYSIANYSTGTFALEAPIQRSTNINSTTSRARPLAQPLTCNIGTASQSRSRRKSVGCVRNAGTCPSNRSLRPRCRIGNHTRGKSHRGNRARARRNKQARAVSSSRTGPAVSEFYRQSLFTMAGITETEAEGLMTGLLP